MKELLKVTSVLYSAMKTNAGNEVALKVIYLTLFYVFASNKTRFNEVSEV